MTNLQTALQNKEIEFQQYVQKTQQDIKESEISHQNVIKDFEAKVITHFVFFVIFLIFNSFEKHFSSTQGYHFLDIIVYMLEESNF